jgi:hypothetical protein
MTFVTSATKSTLATRSLLCRVEGGRPSGTRGVPVAERPAFHLETLAGPRD